MAAFPEIPGYNIEKHLGQGRLTDVYLATPQAGGQKVVIKVLRPEFNKDPMYGKRFLYEAKRASQLDHPNIARILDMGETDKYRYFVIEYFSHGLRERIVKQHLSTGTGLEIENSSGGSHQGSAAPGELDIDEIMDFLRQIFDALDYAHQEEVLHRDLRPDNIFFKEDGSPVITDFYMAEMLRSNQELREQRLPVCPYHYSCPEIALKKNLGPASDIYSLGITLYEYLVGQVPYDAEEPIAIENKHVMDPIPKLPEPFTLLQPLLNRMMAKETAKRAQSGAEMILMMEEVHEDAAEEPAGEFSLEIPNTEQKDKSAAETLMGELDLQLEGFEVATSPPPAPEPPAPPAPDAKPAEQGLTLDLPVPERAKPDLPTPDLSPAPEMPPAVPVQPPVTETSTSPAPPEEATTPDEMPELDLSEELDLGTTEEEEEYPRERRVMLTREEPSPGILDRLKSPVIWGTIVGLVIIAAVVYFFVLPGGGGEETASEKTPFAEPGRKLTPEEEKEREIQYVRKYRRAERHLRDNKLDVALEQVEEAKRYKTTPELEKLENKIKEKIKYKSDDSAYAQARKTNTPEAFREYIDKFPQGRHVKESNTLIAQLKAEARKKAEERRRWAASRVNLRSTPAVFNAEEAREIVIKRGFYDKYYNKNGNFQNSFELHVLDTKKVVVDNATGLMWLQSGSRDQMSFDKVREWLDGLNQGQYAGFSDWRLPTIEEAASLMEPTESRYSLYIDVVFHRAQKYIWTSDKVSDRQGWAVDYFGGDINRVPLSYEAFIRPVRSQD